jgi:glycosyltransferase involved in cell wall biosynthesis
VPYGGARCFTVSERTKRDLVELYDVDPDAVVVTPNGVDPAFTPGPGSHDYVLSVGAIQRRKNQLAALVAAKDAGLPLVVAGPEKDAALAAELRLPEHGSRGTSRQRASSSYIAVQRVSSRRAATRGSGSRSSRRWRRHAGRGRP